MNQNLYVTLLALLLLGISREATSSSLSSEEDEFDKIEALWKSNIFDNRLSQTPSYDGQSADDNVTITVVFYFDTTPRDIGYAVTSLDGSTIFAQADVSTFTDEEYQNRLYATTIELSRGYSYLLKVKDMSGDGLEGPSFYAIYYGDYVDDSAEEILKEDQFDVGQHEVIFVADRPGTSTPTTSGSPTVSPSPTHAPTSCELGSLDFFKVKDNAKDHEPHFKTSLTAFPATSNYCTSHRSYQHCTNEQREDCQWQFLSAGGRKGVCRVDPVSKCLRENNCVCDTKDFKGGSGTMGEGILFHIPVSVTTQDIGPYRNQLDHHELYTPPRDDQQHKKHPQDDDFYISRTDFTARKLIYNIGSTSPMLSKPFERTFAFKLHYLYWDTPLLGRILNGMGLSVHVDTSNASSPTISINSHTYAIPTKLKKWTCTSVVITKTSIFVAGSEITRQLETETPQVIDNRFELGQFSGELFDVRIYRGTLSWREIREFGARCTTPDDTAALQYKRDIVNPYYTFGCDPDFERLPADEGGPVPSNARQTYGSGPFATLWMKPRPSPFNTSEYIDVPEGHFDEERFFQQAKLQAYMWEKFIFDIDMIGFNLEPYNSFQSQDQIATFAATFWNNPCRWLHNFNNGWQYPIYGTSIPKWSTKEHGHGDLSAVFDLGVIYETRADWTGAMSFIAHEMFHGVQGHVGNAFAGKTSRWFAESTAEFGADFAFPASNKIIAPVPISPSYPLAMQGFRDKERGPHFMTDALSINDWVRGGHMYGSWLLWWFLSEHAGLPHIIGEVYSNWNRVDAYTSGELFLVREIIENANMDFGDVWATCIAHMRTWDFPKFGELYREAEREDFVMYMTNPDVQPPLPRNTTLEGRKTSVEIDPHFGTEGQLEKGPEELRPGPNGWNCLTIRRVEANRYVSIQLAWDHGVGFDQDVKPERLRQQQHECDTDPRFYNSVVVAHNEETGERRYWKLKGRSPPTLNIFNSEGSVTFHVLLVPTPPTDYIGGVYMLEESGWDERMSPIPAYGYQYSVSITPQAPAEEDLAAEEEMANGLMKFDKATSGWWPVDCTCMENPNDPRNRCVRPTFDGVGVSAPPSEVPATESPSEFPTEFPTATQSPTFKAILDHPSRPPSLSLMPTITPSKRPSASIVPTIAPSQVSETPSTEAPTVAPTEAPSRRCMKWGGVCGGKADCCSQRCFFHRFRDPFGRCV